MRIKISYPSGNILHVRGQWKGPGNVMGTPIILIMITEDWNPPVGSKMDDGSSPVVKAGCALIGDPRGVYQNEDSGKLLFNPRDWMEGMEQWSIDWLNEHPEWPAILELT